MDELLKKRMSATQQASELEVGNEAYEKLFQTAHTSTEAKFCELSIDRLRPFFTADIGFHPYPPEKLKAFSQQLSEQGIYERIIVRPIPNDDHYEILAGHNRTAAWNMNGHSTIPCPYALYRMNLRILVAQEYLPQKLQVFKTCFFYAFG